MIKFSQFVILTILSFVLIVAILTGCISYQNQTEKINPPKPVSEENKSAVQHVIAISASEDHSLALLENGTIIGWGSNANNLSMMPDLTDMTAISAGTGYSVAVKKDGSVIVWGCSKDLKKTETSPCNVPLNLTNVKTVSAGPMGCVLAIKMDGTVTAWGQNSSNCVVPQELKNVTVVSSGFTRSFALKDDGSIVGWGNIKGKIPFDHKRYVGIAQDYSSTLFLREDGKIDTLPGAPSYHPDLSNVTAIAGMSSGSCYFVGLFENGTVTNWWCDKEMNEWAITPRISTSGKNLTNITSISQSARHTLALKDNGKMVIWGNCGWSYNCSVPDKLIPYFDSIYW
jgi:alpha-tubulin suppressor-like RCC1 family protein